MMYEICGNLDHYPYDKDNDLDQDSVCLKGDSCPADRDNNRDGDRTEVTEVSLHKSRCPVRWFNFFPGLPKNVGGISECKRIGAESIHCVVITFYTRNSYCSVHSEFCDTPHTESDNRIVFHVIWQISSTTVTTPASTTTTALTLTSTRSYTTATVSTDTKTKSIFTTFTMISTTTIPNLLPVDDNYDRNTLPTISSSNTNTDYPRRRQLQSSTDDDVRVVQLFPGKL